MGRERRHVNMSGELYCKSCSHWVHISNYTTREVWSDITPWEDIWFTDPDTGMIYGRPAGYCRKCASMATRPKHKREEYLAMLRQQDRDRIRLTGEPMPDSDFYRKKELEDLTSQQDLLDKEEAFRRLHKLPRD